MRVKVDLAKCEGQGRCFEMSSDVFKRGDNGKCVVVVADVDRDNFDLLLQAEQAEMMCPAGAVTVE